MRRRLVVAITVVAAAAVVLFAVPLAFVLDRGYRDQELLRLQRDAVSAARRIDLSSQPGDTVEIPPVRGDVLAAYDGRGTRVAGRGPLQGDAAVADTLRTRRPVVRRGSGRLVATVPLQTGERITGAVRVQRSDDVVVDRSHRAWLLLAGVGAAVVMLAALAAALLARRLAAPLERVASVARRLGEGDFSVRAPRGDVAEVDAVAAALDTAAARLDELVTRERAFSADASHQLRTPLAALRLELESGQLRGADVAGALAQVDRLEETITLLLSVARDAPRTAPATADLRELADAAETRWHGPLAATGRPLRVNVAADTPPLAEAAAPVIREILDVLLDNAQRHGAGAVTIAVRQLDSHWCIDVGDEGPGIRGDPDAVFARRSDGAGHGIGLALARSLAHAEGGRLTLAAPGPHPVFTLVLAGASPSA